MIREMIKRVVCGVDKVLTPGDLEVSDAILAEVYRQDLCHDGFAVLDIEGVLSLLRNDYGYSRSEVLDGIEQLKFENRIREVLYTVDGHRFVEYHVVCGDFV